MGIGCGTHLQAGFAVIQFLVEPSLMSYAITFMMVAQLIGIGLGLSVAGAVFVNEAISALTAALPGAARVELIAAISGASGSFFSELSPELQLAAVVAVVASIRKLFLCVTAAGAFGLFLSLFLKVCSSEPYSYKITNAFLLIAPESQPSRWSSPGIIR